MKVLEKVEGEKTKIPNGTYDPSMDNLPTPRVVLEKVERAREFLKKHPIPEYLVRKK